MTAPAAARAASRRARSSRPGASPCSSLKLRSLKPVPVAADGTSVLFLGPCAPQGGALRDPGVDPLARHGVCLACELDRQVGSSGVPQLAQVDGVAGLQGARDGAVDRSELLRRPHRRRGYAALPTPGEQQQQCAGAHPRRRCSCAGRTRASHALRRRPAAVASSVRRCQVRIWLAWPTMIAIAIVDRWVQSKAIASSTKLR